MRFVVLGAGAVGGVVGGYLARAGSSVVLIGRRDHVARINERGLQIKTREGVHLISVPAVERAAQLQWGADDLVLVCVKTQHTEGALAELSRHAHRDTPIFCVQNGVRGEEIASRRFANVYGVMVGIGARFTSPGEIVNYTENNLAIGRYPTGIDGVLERAAKELERSGIRVFPCHDVMAVKWNKLIVNLTNAIYAITGASILEARNSADGRALLAATWEEGLRVLDSAGVHYEPLPGRPSVRDEVARLRGALEPKRLPDDPDLMHYPSTWQDLFLGRGHTEASFLNGEIIELGKRHGVPTPINDLLLETVESMAASGERPGRHSLEELRRLATV